MKSVLKITLVIALFCSASFAEGEMGNGGKSCQAPCLVDNQPTTTITKDSNQKVNENDFLIFVKEFLSKIFW